MRKGIAIIFFMLSHCIILAQDMNAVMNKVMDTYQKTKTYKMNYVYTIYSDSISSIKKDELKGEFFKKEKDYYFKMKDSEMIFTKEYIIKISHLEKIILYSNKNTISNELINNQTPFMAFMDKFQEKEIKDKGGFWECTFSKPSSPMPYKEIVLQVSKKNYTVLKQIYFFNQSVEKHFNSNAENTAHERLEIVLTSFNTDPVIPEDVFGLKKYITKTNNGFTPTNYIKNYKILVQ